MDAVINQKKQGLSSGQASNKPILGGIVTGQAAGLIMAVVVMIVFALFLGKSPLYPVQVIGSMVFGESALPNFHLGALLAGLILHQLGPSLLWGTIFGVLAKKLSIETTGQALKFIYQKKLKRLCDEVFYIFHRFCIFTFCVGAHKKSCLQ